MLKCEVLSKGHLHDRVILTTTTGDYVLRLLHYYYRYRYHYQYHYYYYLREVFKITSE